jgi:predicted nucleic acid-binding protein
MPLLVDTDVLIWHLRGHAQAAERLDQLAPLTLSSMTYLELLQGMRSKQELTAVQQMWACIASVTPLHK